MKASKQFALAATVLSIVFFTVSACKKSSEKNEIAEAPVRAIDTSNARPPNPILPPSSILTTAFAGSDQSIELPLDYIFLKGSYKAENQVEKIHWKQIYGPAAFIEEPDSLTTRVSGLQEGFYQFELMVVDKEHLLGRDIVSVTVKRAKLITKGDHFVIFHDVKWVFPWYNSLEAEDIYKYIPRGVPIQVFVQRGTSSNWIKAAALSIDPNNNRYEYFIETRPDGAGMYTFGSLYVFYYGTDVSDNPKIKVEF